MAADITDLFAVNPHDAYYVKGTVNSYPVHFMLDTGAAVCLLDTSVWQRIKGEAVLLPWVRSRLVGVAGTPLQVRGTTKLQVEFGGQRHSMDVIVADSLRTEAILGLDFLDTHQCVIDVGHHKLNLKGHGCPIPLSQNKSSLPLTKDVRVVLPCDVFIPGSSVLEIGAVLQGKIDTLTTIIVEREELQEPSVLLATCIVEPKSDTENPVVPVKLMNLSSEGGNYL